MSGIIDTVGAKSGIVGSDVYPAGHVLQTTAIVHGTTVTALSGAWTSSVVTTAITPLYSDSSILLFSNFMMYFNDNSSDAGWATRVKKVHSGGTSYPTSMDTYQGSGGQHSSGYNNLDTGDAGSWLAKVTQDPTVGVAGSSVSYTIDGYAYNVNLSASLGGNLSNRWWIYLQEVKR